MSIRHFLALDTWANGRLEKEILLRLRWRDDCFLPPQTSLRDQFGIRRKGMERILILGAAFVAFTIVVLLGNPLVYAAAPLRTNQPYAESICNTDPDVIFCEDFNYPQNFFCSMPVGVGNHFWHNPGFAVEATDWVYNCQGRRINPASGGSSYGYTYPTKPQGMMHSVACSGGPTTSGCDQVWVGNWDSAQGEAAAASSPGRLRKVGGNYVNGSPPATDFYVRFQIYFTPNFVWAGDPKVDKYNYANYPCRDTKLFFFGGVNFIDNPTSASMDAGAMTGCGVWEPQTNARYADALVFRIGDAGDAYRSFPLCSQCSVQNPHYEYGPFQCNQNTAACWRNPNDAKTLGRIWRFNTGQWYTLEFHYVIRGSGTHNGTVEAWIDGTKIYSANDLMTCQANSYDDCSGLGSFFVLSYHSEPGTQPWNGQQIMDNLIISRKYIGPPPGGGSNPPNSQPGVPGAVQVH
jgi:hypothetical protein